MFQVIEYARMMVGTKAISTLSTGYLNALDYAKQRVQGPDLTQMTDKAAPRVTITHHPDVRLMLMRQKAWAEGMRALVLYTAHIQDEIALAESEGTDPKQANLLVRLNDLLLPVVKAYGSEKGYELLATSLQILGGSGYLQDYPIEQYIRDAKIDTLYEGTTSIQGMDFFFRKIIRDKGKALNYISREMREFVKARRRRQPDRRARAARQGDGRRRSHRVDHGRAPHDHSGRASQRLQGGPQHHPPADGERRRRRGVAAAAPGRGGAGRPRCRDSPSARDKAFYEGKVAAAKWFARNVLPSLPASAAHGRGRRPRPDGPRRRVFLRRSAAAAAATATAARGGLGRHRQRDGRPPFRTRRPPPPG